MKTNSADRSQLQNFKHQGKKLPYFSAWGFFLGLITCTLWSSAIQAGEIFNLNQSWDFFRPAVAAAPKVFKPAPALLVAQGEFKAGIAPQDATFAAQNGRYVCLQSDSAYQGNFASVAEFDLLDAGGHTLPRNGWRVAYADSTEGGDKNDPANAIDGRADTIWHTAWSAKSPAHPHYLVLDLGANRDFSGFRYLPRQDRNPSGAIKGWKFFVSNDPFPQPSLESDQPPTDASWEQVNLPHSVRLEPLNASGGRNYQGVCWYRRSFTAREEWKNKTTYLRFEGAMQVAQVWLNGELITKHFGGYQPFTLDLTEHLKFGVENSLLVRLDNSDNPEVPPGKAQNQLDFTYFGGLYRSVALEVDNWLHITDELIANEVAGGGIFIRFPKVTAEQAVVSVQTEVANDNSTSQACEIQQELLDTAGKVVASASQHADITTRSHTVQTLNLTVDHPALWHPNHPHLYKLRTSVMVKGKPVDERVTRVGIRRVEFTAKGMFINGEKFFAQGFNRHQDHPYVGYALPDSQHYRDAKKMRDAGMTSFRSHYPQAPAFMDACDELGILCIVSNPGWQFFGNKTWLERINQNAREMVRRNRNHPSAIVWEPFPNETQYPEAFARTLHNIIHEEFPGDQCFTGGDGNIGNGKNFIDVVWAWREANSDKPEWLREWGDSVDDWSQQQGRVRVARGWGELPLITQAVNHAIKLDSVLSGGVGGTPLAGACLWAGIDCYRGYHHQPFLGGPLDLFRLPKFSYYVFQSQRDPSVKIDGVDCGPMVFIANYASAWSPASVAVFSNCEEVRFYENGKLTATHKPDPGYVLAHPPFTFKAKVQNSEKNTYYMTNDTAANAESGYHYKPSEYKAEGLIGGQVVATHSIKAAGAMCKLMLDVDYSGRKLTADGGDWIRVYAKVCDVHGTVHPLADDLITFSVEGEGALIGDASIGANPVRAEAGIATALVQASTRPGKITVRAAAFDLKPAEVVISTEPAAGLFLNK